MKYILYPFAFVFFYITNGCVQKATKKTVVITLTVQNMKDIKTAGIRGNGKPLSWDNDFEMKEVIKDSIYTATATTVTGYKFAEIKFTVNGEFELKEQPNRKLVFSDSDTTYYNATFNTIK
jgi:hypothetical protein